jgi:ankyrin repeat protein
MDIWTAAHAGDLAEVEALLGDDPSLLDARDDAEEGWTPLIASCAGGHVAVVRFLLDRNAAVNEQDNGGMTALYVASMGGQLPIVTMLLERGADPTTADNDGHTPLVLATCKAHQEIVRCLLDHPSASTTINRRGPCGATPLLYACALGSGPEARLLLERGADPTIPDDEGIPAMALASTSHAPEGVSVEGRRECVKALQVRCSFVAL